MAWTEILADTRLINSTSCESDVVNHFCFKLKKEYNKFQSVEASVKMLANYIFQLIFLIENSFFVRCYKTKVDNLQKPHVML